MPDGMRRFGSRKRGLTRAKSHIERMLEDLPAHCLLITVIDGHPATLSWLGGVSGHKTVPLGVEHFGQTGTVSDLYRHFGIDWRSHCCCRQRIIARAKNRLESG